MVQYLVFVGAIVMFYGSLSYIWATLRGETKPNKVTWLLWGIAPLIGTAAAFSDGVRLATLPVLVTGMVPLIVFAASFVNKNAYWKLARVDYICGFIAILALVLWRITDDPIIAIQFAILSDALAALPTFIKSWKFSETESGIAYTTGIIGNATSFFAIKTGNFSEWAFPVCLVATNALIALAIYRKRIFLGFPFFKHGAAADVAWLPEGMRALAQEIAAQPDQAGALRFAYEALAKKYRGYRSLTFLRLDRLFIRDIATLWKIRGFLHCHHINYLLRTLLMASGRFSAHDLVTNWTQVWFFSPHEYLVVHLKNGEAVNVDLWAKVYGITFGHYAHGFQSGSFFARIEK